MSASPRRPSSREHSRRRDTSQPSPTFARFRPTLESRLVPAYRPLGTLVCAYAQGSLVEGLADAGDIDVVLAWEDGVPAPSRRPPPGLADASPEPIVYHVASAFVVDRVWTAGQQLDVKHMTRAELDSWAEAVETGEGRAGYPMPVIGIHGLVNGVVLADDQGHAARLISRLMHVPVRFRRAAALSDEAVAGNLQELSGCVRRGDQLLFHSLAVEAVRAAFIAWFATRDMYWPHEKRLGQRLRRLGHGDLAALEEQFWTEQGLASQLAILRQLLERLSDGR
jgi:hypothetical protein